MNICTSCGVELEEGLTNCPLCSGDSELPGSEIKKNPKSASEVMRAGSLTRRQHLWELSGIVAASAMIVCTIVDLVIDRGLYWSLFADISVTSVWIILTLIIWSGNRTIFVLSGLTVTISCMLALFNILTGPPEWVTGIALPIIVSLFILSVSIELIGRKAKLRGFGLLASAFLAVALFLVTTEVLIDIYKNGVIEVIWSAIAAASIVPITLVLFFMHYRMKKGNSLESLFHI
jgi:hypothetical protein